LSIHEQIIEFFDQFTQMLIASELFQAIGLVVLFAWTIIPSVKSIFPEVFSLPLLLAGTHPVVLITVSALGATLGDYILYVLGRGAHRLFTGKKKELAEADHLLHKYRLPIFFGTPFIGVFGDIIMFVAGAERIGFMRILPFLLAGQFLRMTIGMLGLLGLVQLPQFFGFG